MYSVHHLVSNSFTIPVVSSSVLVLGVFTCSELRSSLNTKQSINQSTFDLRIQINPLISTSFSYYVRGLTENVMSSSYSCSTSATRCALIQILKKIYYMIPRQ
jgi:hypothetical protein